MNADVDAVVLKCPTCGQLHQAVPLHAGQRATCVRCGESLQRASRFGSQAAPAFAAAALVLAIPAANLPLVTLTKFGAHHPSFLASGANGLTQGGLPHLAALVFACAIVAPVVLASLLIASWGFAQKRPRAETGARLQRAIEFVEYWAMPEVYVLAILIAFVKLDQLVHVTARAGLWCYAAMALMGLWAWRTVTPPLPLEMTDPRGEEAS